MKYLVIALGLAVSLAISLALLTWLQPPWYAAIAIGAIVHFLVVVAYK